MPRILAVANRKIARRCPGADLFSGCWLAVANQQTDGDRLYRRCRGGVRSKNRCAAGILTWLYRLRIADRIRYII